MTEQVKPVATIVYNYPAHSYAIQFGTIGNRVVWRVAGVRSNKPGHKPPSQPSLMKALVKPKIHTARRIR